jgi:hypothetical protein
VKDYGKASAEAVANTPSAYPPAEVAKRVIAQVPELHLLDTERVSHFPKQSASARNAQLHQTPMVQEELTQAFAARMKRKAEIHLDDHILANLT